MASTEKSISTVVAVGLCWLLLAGVSAADEVVPKPISEVERAAVDLAARYLESGPASWWPVLSTGSPLRVLGEKSAKREIAVRCGPAKGATWRLQTSAPGWEDVVIFTIDYPSGLDETLSLELVQEDGWRIDRLRTLAEPPPHRAGIDEVLDTTASGVDLDRSVPLLLLACVAAMMALGCTGLACGRGKGALQVLGLFGLAVGLLTWSCSKTEERVAAQSPETFSHLASLLTLREITTTGGVDPEALFAQLPTDGVVGEVGKVWEAAYRILKFELDDAQAILDSFPSPAGNAAVELQRARLGFLRSNEVETLLGFEEALDVGPDHDGLRLEMAQSHAQLGFMDKSEIAFALLRGMGSREPDVYYTLAQFATLDGRMEEAIESFEIAWHLLPVEREALFSDPFLAYLATRPKVFPLLELASVLQPAVARSIEERQPLTFPETAEPRLSGDLLEVELGDAKLLLPGGGIMAAIETPIEDPGTRTRREEERALGRLGELIDATRTPGALAQPLLRRQAQTAALALFRDHRWEQLIELTEGLVSSLDHAPPILAKLRALALTEKGRSDDATDLLLKLARSDLDRGRQDPATLYQLAEVFASTEEFDLAVRLLRKAETLSPFEPDYRRLQRFRMQQELAENHQGYTSAHFNVRYPKITGEKYARQVSIVLEEEFKRLQRWIPLQSSRLLDVDLFPVIQFLESYSENVLGIYDGRVRVPLADLRSLHPQLVALLSHELAHAMIAERTYDRAPMWFHEGLAQHVQMVMHTANPAGDLVSADRMLSLSVVESVLNGFVEPQFVEISYSLSSWFLHFIEMEFGRPAIARLMAAFAAGQDTEEALVSVLGVTIAEFDSRFLTWALNKAPAMWTTDLRRYDTEAAVASLLGEGHRGRVPTAAPQRTKRTTDATMNQWYRYYDSHFGPVKVSFLQTVAALRRSDRTHALKIACGQLRTEAKRAQTDDRLLASPDPKVGRQIEVVLRELRALAETCLSQGGPSMQSRLRAAEKSLVGLDAALEPWGLRP